MEELDRHRNVSQRRLGERLGIAASMVNRLIADLVQSGVVRVVDTGVRPFAYTLTERGREYCQQLRYEHVHSVVGTFREVQERIRGRLKEVNALGVRRLVFYGTGDVMDVTYPLAESLGLEVVGLVDDDPDKQGSVKRGHRIEPPGAMSRLRPDAVVITTFRYAREILDGLDEGTCHPIVVEL